MDFPIKTEWMFSQSNKNPNRPLIIGNSLNESTSLRYENNTVNQTPDRESWILTPSGNTPETPYNLRHSLSTQSSSTDKDIKPKLKRGRKSMRNSYQTL